MRLLAEVTGRIRVVSIGSPSHVDELATWVGALTDDITVVSGTTSGERGLEEVIEHLPDIVVIHLEPFAVETFDLVSDLLGRFPAMKVVALFSNGTTEPILRLLRIGVRGILRKGVDPGELVTALRAVQAGHTVVDLDASRRVFGVEGRRVALRRAETQILRLMAQGCAYEEICERLAISRSTLKRYLREIESKLNARNRVQAVAHATRQGLI